MERCTATASAQQVAVSSIDFVDVLFVIDDSPSMAEEQIALAREIPDLMRALTEGTERADGTRIVPAGSLHVGVVSSNAGLGAASSETGCSSMDQAGMLHHSAACGAGDASFVWHFSGYHDPEQTIAAISCDAQLGANGCGVAQPIESAEEALLPLATRNPGFLRSDPKRGRSLVLIVIITDNDDYSLADRPQLDRYLTDLQAVRPAGWLQVAIIAGLPPDLERDFVDSDEPPNLYYDRVLADPRMLRDGVACEGAAASARAPRRLVQFAKAFGANASVTSICREDWKHALFYHLQEGIRDIVTVCLPRDHGLVNEHSTCRMTWELPFEHDPEQPLTPATCADQPEFLSTPEPEFPRMSERGRTLCEVRRAPFVQDSMSGEVEVDGEGFYAPLGPCSGGTGGIGRVVSFTGRAKPPHGVTVRLSCTESECEDLGQRR